MVENKPEKQEMEENQPAVKKESILTKGKRWVSTHKGTILAAGAGGVITGAVLGAKKMLSDRGIDLPVPDVSDMPDLGGGEE